MMWDAKQPQQQGKQQQWERMHGLLVGFVEREGHARVPRCHVEDGERLGAWVQRHHARRPSTVPVGPPARR